MNYFALLLLAVAGNRLLKLASSVNVTLTLDNYVSSANATFNLSFTGLTDFSGFSTTVNIIGWTSIVTGPNCSSKDTTV